jgi:hypothetical protein
MAATPLSPATTAFESSAASEFRVWSQYLTPPWDRAGSRYIIYRDNKKINPLISVLEIKDLSLKIKDRKKIAYWMLDTGCWMLDAGFEIVETRHCLVSTTFFYSLFFPKK